MSDEQLALREETAITPKQDVYSAVLSAVNDPNTDPARLREFLAIAKEMEADQARRLFVQAFNAAKREMDGLKITRQGKIEYRTGPGPKYAKYNDIARVVKPILNEHGFTESFSYRYTENPPKTICVMKLMHVAGHAETFESVPMPMVDSSGGKNDVQGAGSVSSYGMRYTLVPAFNILTEEDDDGSGQGVQPLITDEQAADLRDWVTQIEERQKGATKRFEVWLREAHGTDDLDAIHQGPQLESVKRKLRATLNAAKERAGGGK